MTCTSLRKSAGNDGRSGRSVRRHVRIACFARTTFTTEERARDLAGGVHALFDVDGEREEVDALAGLRRTNGGQERGVPDLDQNGTVGEVRQLAGSRESSRGRQH